MKHILIIAVLALAALTACNGNASLPDGFVGRPYQANVTGFAGESPLNWSLVGGVLPDGLSLAPATGEISGAPSRVGRFDFTVRVTDSASPPRETVKDHSIRVLQVTGSAASPTSDPTSSPSTARWKGTMRSEVEALFNPPGATPYSCTSVFDATLTLVGTAKGQISGDGRAVYASTNCRGDIPPFSALTFRVQGQHEPNTNWMVLNFVFGEISPPGTYNWGFGATYFSGEPFRVTILSAGVAESQKTSEYAPNSVNTYTSNTTISLTCEKCTGATWLTMLDTRGSSRYSFYHDQLLPLPVRVALNSK